MTAGSEEPNAIVQLHKDTSRTEPNVRATEIEIYEGLEASSQNCWPSVNFDIGGINNFLSPLLPAGFYYKTFMGPKGFWKNVYEPLIRRTAGLGKPPKEFKSKSIHQHHNVDVIIVGGGLSGLLAARKFAGTNYDVLLVEREDAFGGILKNANKIKSINDQSADEWLEKTERLILSLIHI